MSPRSPIYSSISIVNGLSQAAEMMMKVTAVNKWCVTGTPVQRCLLGKKKSPRVIACN